MTWQSIDFQGIATFDRALSEQLHRYLADKDAYFSDAIAFSLPLHVDVTNPILPSDNIQKTLVDGIEAFTQKVKFAIQNPAEKISWEKLADRVNSILWEYTELLQGIAVELFQQLEQVTVEQWRPELVKVVNSIKETLIHYMDELKWAVKQLEASLKDYRSSQTEDNWSGRLGRILPQWKTITDSAIVKNLEKSQKFLDFRFQNFLNKYDNYIDLERQVDKKMSKFLSYRILRRLEPEDQENFRSLYRLLKLWKINHQTKALPERELVRVLRYTINPEKASNLFKHYYQALENQLYLQSRELKELSHASEDDHFGSSDAIKQLEFQSMLSGQRFELHTLGATISAYRSFLLESDPNPYVRTRGGFSEWVIGHEPSQTQAFIDQEFKVEKLDILYKQFADSLRNPLDNTPTAQDKIFREAQSILHDMAQPLASHAMMNHLTHEFIDKLSELNELGSQNSESVDQITTLLSRALRADWKYTTLYDIPKFHELYNIHMHILPIIPDRPHVTRLRQFKQLLEKLKQWVQEKSVQLHLHDVELTINDIKGYLQDFLAQVQRISRDSSSLSYETISEIAQQLLEYRYLFGQFFHLLRQTEMEERLLRNRFLFVDHYFESIENKLVEMREELRRMQDTNDNEQL